MARKPFLTRALCALEKLAPLKFAEQAWDNVGLLLEAPAHIRPNAERILLAVDVTPEVVQEAVCDEKVGMIVGYHPTIFRGLKRINLYNSGDLDTVTQDSVIRLAAAGISLYSPHTALDNILGGVNDWLLDGLRGIPRIIERRPIVPAPNATDGVGAGRMCILESPVDVGTIIGAIKAHLGLSQVRYVKRQNNQSPTETVKSIAVCAGSGGSILGAPLTDASSATVAAARADLVWTGELGHHEMLKIRRCSHIVLCEHSNTERGYLSAVLAPRLREQGFDVSVSMTDTEPVEFV